MAKRQDHSGNDYDRAVGDRIRRAREAMRPYWSQETLAANLPGFPRLTGSQVAKRERGEQQIEIDFVRRCADAMQIPMVELLEGPAQPIYPTHGLALRILELAEPKRHLVELMVDEFSEKIVSHRKPRAAPKARAAQPKPRPVVSRQKDD